MNTPNIDTIETVLKMIDHLESSNTPYIIKMQSIHYQICSIATLADDATYKYCTLISRNYQNAQLQMELSKLKGSN